MTWAERIKASWSGDVAGGDVSALLAASGSLDILRQQLADRRLSAQIDHIGEEWRILADIAPLAMPLWLGDGLVTLARSLCEAEAEAHPDRPNSLSPASHDLAAAVLRPIETIVAEASADAADPARPPWIVAAIMVGPRGEVAAFSLPRPVPAGYVHGLMLAAERLHGAAGLLLADLTALLQPSQPPDWLAAGLQRVKGDMAAAGARLAMLRTRLNMLVPDPQRFQAGFHDDTLAPVCHDLWEVVNTALVGGQRLSDPRLMPGARSAAAPVQRPAPSVPSADTRPSGPVPRVVPSSPPATPAPPPPPQQAPLPPWPPARVERARDLPDIQTLPVPADHSRQPLADRQQPDAAGADRSRRLAGDRRSSAGSWVASRSARSLPKIEAQADPDDQEAHELPQIGPG